MARRQYTDEQWQDVINVTMMSLPTGKVVYSTPNALPSAVASYIDHTLLKLDATESQIDQLCEEAKRWNLKACCVRPHHVRRAVQNLQGTSVLVASVVGFHEGTHSTEDKINEARLAIQHGAKELDMVINPIHLQTKNYVALYNDILTVRNVAPPNQITLKCILEATTLTKEQLVAASLIAIEAGADYLKTSTGFIEGSRAKVEDVALMKKVAEHAPSIGLGLEFGGDENKKKRLVKVKASGGIKTMEDLMKMIEAGADRIGTSSGDDIMREVR